MRIGVPQEVAPHEHRVALGPDHVAKLVRSGFQVQVEAGAGKGAYFSDPEYEAAGARLVSEREELWTTADLLTKVAPPTEEEVDRLREGAVLVGFLNPLANPSLVQRIADRGITAFAMELIPRISRAQSMDALSSQSSVAGYKTALLAAARLPKFFPMMTTAAGTLRPAKVFVLGAGVAGLQAIATARRLGAVVEAFDIRPAVKEEVESLGATFVQVEEVGPPEEGKGEYAKEVTEEERRREQDLLAEHVAAADVVITTAQVPGKRAPVLVTKAMVAAMRPGSVIVDLAADQGGNCELTRMEEEVVHNGVTILGPANLPATVPTHSSQMYSRNLFTLLGEIVRDGELRLDFQDEVIDGACLTHQGEVRNERVREALAAEGRGKEGRGRREKE